MSYRRVIPRDLFNEAKLLKCVGQLSLLIHGGLADPLVVDYGGGPFEVVQDSSNGGLFLSNVKFRVGVVSVPVQTTLNSLQAYPLVFTALDGREHMALTDAGGMTPEFRDHLNRLKEDDRRGQ